MVKIGRLYERTLGNSGANARELAATDRTTYYSLLRYFFRLPILQLFF